MAFLNLLNKKKLFCVFFIALSPICFADEKKTSSQGRSVSQSGYRDGPSRALYQNRKSDGLLQNNPFMPDANLPRVVVENYGYGSDNPYQPRASSDDSVQNYTHNGNKKDNGYEVNDPYYQNNSVNKKKSPDSSNYSVSYVSNEDRQKVEKQYNTTNLNNKNRAASEPRPEGKNLPSSEGGGLKEDKDEVKKLENEMENLRDIIPDTYKAYKKNRQRFLKNEEKYIESDEYDDEDEDGDEKPEGEEEVDLQQDESDIIHRSALARSSSTKSPHYSDSKYLYQNKKQKTKIANPKSGRLLTVIDKKQKKAKDLNMPIVPMMDSNLKSSSFSWKQNVNPPNVSQAYFFEKNKHISPAIFETQSDYSILQKYVRNAYKKQHWHNVIAALHNIDFQDNNGNSALFYAVSNNDVQAVSMLISAGASVNIRNKFGQTPLHIASQLGNLNTASILVSGGAIVDMKDIFGNTPISVAIESNHNDVANLMKIIATGTSDVKTNDSVLSKKSSKNGFQEIRNIDTIE